MKVYLIGTGMGDADSLIKKAEAVIAEADVLFGARRLLLPYLKTKRCVAEYLPEKIADCLEGMKNEKPKPTSIAVLVSGDSGFYSACKRICAQLLQKGMDIEILPGISSLSYLSSKTGISWEDAKILSLHGREGNLLQAVRSHKKVFVLCGNDMNLEIERLQEANLGLCRITLGENLASPQERIWQGTVQKWNLKEISPLSVMLIENASPEEKIRLGIREEEWVRGEVPMTKSEVRVVTLSKLALSDYDVVYDVGAGTGSVSIEMALMIENGCVYAIEEKADAIALIKKNKEKFNANNLEIIEGNAPKALEKLPAPDAVFIGGSGGNLREIMETVLVKNPEVRIVMNFISMENVAQAMQLLKHFAMEDIQIVQMSVSKARKVGKNHLLMAENPVTIVSAKGRC